MKTSTTSLLAAGSLLLPHVAAADRSFTWDLTYSVLPGTQKEAILINNQWPPAPIEVDVGDRISLNVNNGGVDEGVSVHAHGFHQKNNNQNDGPVGVTQCAIPKGGSQTYTWNAEQPGSFWVHSHKVSQYPLGLRSPLIVRSKDEPAYYGYDAAMDFVMDVSDNWSESFSAVEAKFKTGVCCMSGLENSVCGLEVPPNGALAHDNLAGNTIYDAKALGDKKMRVRLINMSAASQFVVFSNDPSMDLEIIEVDGVPLKNTAVTKAKSVELHPGQRYSVLVKSTKNFLLNAVIDPVQYSGNTCQDMKTYNSRGRTTLYNYAAMATAKFDVGKGAMPAPYFAPNAYCTDTSKPCYTRGGSGPGLLHSLVNLPSHAADASKRLGEDWETSGRLTPKVDQPRISYGNDADSTIIRLALTATQGTGKNRFANLNGKGFMEPRVPLLLLQNQPASASCSATSNLGVAGPAVDTYYGANNTFNIKRGTNVFLVVQSAPGLHPFHLHGHDFQVLYHGNLNTGRPGQAAPTFDENIIKQNRIPNAPALPLRRDTTFVGPGAYTVLAFKADNPGAWFLHCHNDFHSMTGMAGTILVDSGAATSDAWDGKAVGQQLWDQCRFKTQNGGGFADWTRQCSAGAAPPASSVV